MSKAIDILGSGKPKHVAIIASNPSVSEQTGWPIGFWWGELTHPYWEFVESGYDVDIISPDGDVLKGDGFSDPRDESGYSTEVRKLPNTNFIVDSMFKPFAIRDGNLIIGQQQYAGDNAARLLVQALG